jgi:hypothetical protein
MKEHVSLLVALRPDQREALVALAEERRKPGERPPISEVVREALDRGLGIRGPLTPGPPPPVAVRVKVSPRRPRK